MNKRIIELFEQAANEFSAEHKYATFIVLNPLKEKFAELIVEECNQYALRNWEHGHLLGQDLKIYFGFGAEE
jgi:hypothetical protein